MAKPAREVSILTLLNKQVTSKLALSTISRLLPFGPCITHSFTYHQQT